jgi:hypothetical protein
LKNISNARALTRLDEHSGAIMFAFLRAVYPADMYLDIRRKIRDTSFRISGFLAAMGILDFWTTKQKL